MSRASREKGARGELEAAKLLSELLGVPVRRRAMQARGAETDGADLAIEGDATLWVEVRRRERSAIPAWLERAVSESGPDRVAVVMHRRSRSQWSLTLRAQDMVEFAQRVVALLEKGGGR